MSADAWDREQYAEKLLRLLPANVSARKFRLFACGCARAWANHITKIDANQILNVAEGVADGTVDVHDWHEAHNTAADYRDTWAPLNLDPTPDFFNHDLGALLDAALDANARNGAMAAVEAFYECETDLGGCVCDPAALVREVFGNPFRPLDFTPWRTDTAVALARAMYESRDFGAMPILADALQDAGCDSDEVLRHCRDATQVHVRGCWVVDGVLGLS